MLLDMNYIRSFVRHPSTQSMTVDEIADALYEKYNGTVELKTIKREVATLRSSK